MSGEAFPDSVRRILASRSPRLHRGDALSPASVLLPLFAPAGGAPELWLVRRADEMRIHGGQVALPGGKQEPSDPDLLATALREAEEEIGLSASDVEVLGRLDDCVTVTGFVVTPFVGWIARPFTPRPLAAEVARVFALPMATFEHPPRTMTVARGAEQRVVLCYDAGGEAIWGATARILAGFAELLGARGILGTDAARH
jgi:8-oxo-dGTP pyrophosphatase MutT (NUDIX family)